VDTHPTKPLRFGRWKRWPRGWRSDPVAEARASRAAIGSILAELKRQYLDDPPVDPADTAAAERLVRGQPAGHGMVRRGVAVVGRLRDLDGLDWATPGFWDGLRLAGALKPYRRSWRLSAHRPWLERAFSATTVPVAMRLGRADGDGRRILHCPAAWLPVGDPYAVDRLAGLLAGGLLRRYDDGWWIVLPRTPEVLRLVDAWGLSVREATWRDGGPRRSVTAGIRVSVFYGALLRDHLPPQVAAGFLAADRAGDCPLLAVTYAGLLWDPKAPHYHWPAAAGVLPWCIASQARIRRGWNREFVHRASVLLGIAHIPLNLRSLLERWSAR
jgi:hypothetical protein